MLQRIKASGTTDNKIPLSAANSAVLTSSLVLCPADSSMTWLTEVVLLGSSDARLSDLNLNEETKTLLELALGSSRGVAGGLWKKMEEYAHSKGTHLCV